MSQTTNKRVIAIESIEDGVCKYYGEGEYIGDLIPDLEPFKTINLKNPCIKLDNGKYVWGFMCWWGSLEKFEEQYKIKDKILVDLPDDVVPFI